MNLLINFFRCMVNDEQVDLQCHSLPYSAKLSRWKSLTNFDERMLNRQNFTYQNFALRKFSVARPIAYLLT